MFGVFAWIRQQARNSVLGGVADALADLTPDDPAPDLDAFRAKLAADLAPTRALPATPEVEAEPVKTKRK